MKEHKHLGLLLESNLSFTKHLTDKIKKDKQNLGIIKHLSRYLPLKTLDQMYKSACASTSWLLWRDLSYSINGNSTWWSIKCPNGRARKDPIPSRSCYHWCKGSNRYKLYEELGWESLSDRRWCRRILQVHKIVNDKTPLNLKNNFLVIAEPLYRQNNNNIFYEIRCKSNRCMNSFFPDGIISLE